MKTFVFEAALVNPSFGRLTRKFVLQADTYDGALHQLKDWCKMLFWTVENVNDLSQDFTSLL